MTDLDAVALSLLGYPRRKLLGALVRHWLARAVPDLDDLPPPFDGEPHLLWACRCAAGPAAAAAEHARLCSEARRTLDEAERRGQAAVVLDSPAYPRALSEIPDPPPVIWVRGAVSALSVARMVAVVGARAASRQGLEIAAALSRGMAGAGVTVVSGLARGVDTAAHRAALDVGGRSVAVLGSGLDRVYPREHEELARRLEEGGATMSEFPPGSPPMAYHFPLRNRLISGLSVATVVVEASEKSGSLITAGAALEQGREVMAVPGPVSGGRHRGAHALLRDGARLVESADDILSELGWAPAGLRTAAGPTGLEAGLATELGLTAGAEDFSTDEVATATGWTISEINVRLGALEIAGRIQRVGGGRFIGLPTRVLT